MRRKPVVGVIGNATRIEGRFPVQVVGERNMRAVAQVAGALPLMFASCPEITKTATRQMTTRAGTGRWAGAKRRMNMVMTEM